MVNVDSKQKQNERNYRSARDIKKRPDLFQYKRLIFSGTFDRLHEGHKYILQRAFSLSKSVLIGVTSDKMVEDKQLAYLIQPADVRVTELELYLKDMNWRSRCEIRIIEDAMGFATTLEDVEAILVSEEPGPFRSAKRINQIREAKGWKLLEIITIPFIKTPTFKRISSLAIRQGKITREGGQLPQDAFRKKILNLRAKHFVLPVNLRETLRAPLGELVKDTTIEETTQLVISQVPQESSVIVSVGDVISTQLDKAGVLPQICFIDFKTKRKAVSRYVPKLDHTLSIRNPPGEITREAWASTQIALDSRGRTVVKVRGEEDLLVIPSILLSPVGTVILYGQPDEGVVIVRVSKEIQGKIFNLLKNFMVLNGIENNR